MIDAMARWPTAPVDPRTIHTWVRTVPAYAVVGRVQVCPRETSDHTKGGVNKGWVRVGEGLGANGPF
jgi:hypothetical protein